MYWQLRYFLYNMCMVYLSLVEVCILWVLSYCECQRYSLLTVLVIYHPSHLAVIEYHNFFVFKCHFVVMLPLNWICHWLLILWNLGESLNVWNCMYLQLSCYCCLCFSWSGYILFEFVQFFIILVFSKKFW